MYRTAREALRREAEEDERGFIGILKRWGRQTVEIRYIGIKRYMFDFDSLVPARTCTTSKRSKQIYGGNAEHPNRLYTLRTQLL